MTLTPDEMSEEERTNASRYIEVDKRGTKTMTRHRMGYMGNLRFKNLADKPCAITASAGKPFKVPGCDDPVGSFSVPGGVEVSVKIHKSYDGEEFTYSRPDPGHTGGRPDRHHRPALMTLRSAAASRTVTVPRPRATQPFAFQP